MQKYARPTIRKQEWTSGNTTMRSYEIGLRGTATGNDHINIKTLKAGDKTFSKKLAKLYTKCL